jgi:LPS sulfotransferase NodH
VPRSGSSLLCGLLESTGVAGRGHEWFWRETEAELRAEWGVSGEREYLERVRDAGTAGGVFGAKVMRGYFGEVLDRLRAFAGDPALNDVSAIESFVPRPRFVWIRREDVVAQAVSWSRAIQGGRWWSEDARPEAPLAFRFEQIDALVREIREHDAAWRAWFAANGVEPVEVRYEEVAAEPVSVGAAVLLSLGIDAAPNAGGVPHRRQADELNAEWAERYRLERARAAE